MELNYVVRNADGQPCGSLTMAVCADYSALDKIMRFSSLEDDARFNRMADPSSFGFNYFEGQLPIRDIYPVAALLNLEIDYKMRRRGYGAAALRAFRVVAAEHKARLGLLRIGTTGSGEYEPEMLWRKEFYSKDGWQSFNSPPLPGLILVWMFHLLPPLTDQEQTLRERLAKAPSREEKAEYDLKGKTLRF